MKQDERRMTPMGKKCGFALKRRFGLNTASIFNLHDLFHAAGMSSPIKGGF